MTRGGESGFPTPPLPRSQRTITAYYAKCRQCKFDSLRPREATTHCLSEGHRLAETRHYVLEPPE